jgi:flavin reductase (DIM6/NTAB) family NADH-FMN oxidoreductase RutF
MATAPLTSPLTEVFREVMAGVCTPVAVVTTITGGRPLGTTVSAFASLSMAPPMVVVSLDRRSDLLAALAEGTPFGVNVLGSSQAALAGAFGRKGVDKFAGVAWHPDSGAPRLDGSPGWLACVVSRLVDGGDHVLVLGEVREAATDPGPPLTYHARTFGTHLAAAH